jgi:hypothetical protein
VWKLLFLQFIRPPQLKLSTDPTDMTIVSAKHYLPTEPVRSKGEAIVLAPGRPELSAGVRDISPGGIGLIAGNPMDPGVAVEVHVHGYSAHGVVQACRPEGDSFYIGIALAA